MIKEERNRVRKENKAELVSREEDVAKVGSGSWER